jgi:hypothetical protein
MHSIDYHTDSAWIGGQVCAHDGRERQREHGDGDVPVPGRLPAGLVGVRGDSNRTTNSVNDVGERVPLRR